MIPAQEFSNIKKHKIGQEGKPHNPVPDVPERTSKTEGKQPAATEPQSRNTRRIRATDALPSFQRECETATALRIRA